MIEIRKLLRCARQSLDLDVAFVSQFVGDRRVFRYVDAAEDDHSIEEGRDGALGTSYCKLVVDGRLPELVRDMRDEPAARCLSATYEPQVGAHISVPMYLADGTVFGTFCCFARDARRSLGDRDLAMVRGFAEVVADRLEQIVRAERRRTDKQRRIDDMLSLDGPEMVYQPVFMLNDLRVAGAEALSRFPRDPGRSIEAWFQEAKEVGLQAELELVAIRNALLGYREIWRTHRIQLGVNASASTIIDDRLWQTLKGFPLDLIVIELTEHEQVQHYGALIEATKRFREAGSKIAIDDVGAGYSSMRHVLNIRPDILKLDVGLVRSIDSDDLKAALTASLKHFADQFDCRIVAEGVETQAELATLRALGLQAAQGYLLGRPTQIGAVKARLEQRGAA